MNGGHVRAAALAAAVIMILAGCAAAHHDVGLAALAKPGDRNVTGGALLTAARELRSKRAAIFSDGKEQEIGNHSRNTGGGGGSPGI